MKKPLLVTAILFLISFNVSAQSKAYRLINHKQYQYNTSRTIPVDSTVYFWSGGRGKNFRTTDQYFADSVLNFTVNLGTGKQNLSFSYHNIFNTFNKTQNHLRRAILNGTVFGDQFKVNFSYDASGNEIKRVHLFYNSSDFKKFDTLVVYIKEFNTKNLLTKEIYKAASSGIVTNQSLKTYSYDANGNLTNYLEQKWKANTWTNYSKDTYTYTAQNKIASRINEIWNNGVWEVLNRYTYTYNQAGIETLLLIEGWDGSNWFNNTRFVSIVNGNNQYTSRVQENFGLSKKWVPANKRLYDYDGAGNRTVETYLKFVVTVQPDSGEFAYDTENSYGYDANKNNTVQYYTELSGFVPDITFRDTLNRFEFTYEEYTNSSGISQFGQYNNVSVFPNPGSDILNIHLPSGISNSPVYISVSNLSGQLIKFTPGLADSQSGRTELNIEDLDSGIYFITVQREGKVYNSRFVKR